MRKDLIIDETTGRLAVKDGDWVVGPSDEQHVRLIMALDKGQIRMFPHIGFGAARKLKRVIDYNRVVRDAKVALAADGYTDTEVTLSEDLIIEINQK
jgi:hypothetical protein